MRLSDSSTSGFMNAVKSDSNVSESTGGNAGAADVGPGSAAGCAATGEASDGGATFAPCAAASLRADHRFSVSGSRDFSSSDIVSLLCFALGLRGERIIAFDLAPRLRFVVCSNEWLHPGHDFRRHGSIVDAFAAIEQSSGLVVADRHHNRSRGWHPIVEHPPHDEYAGCRRRQIEEVTFCLGRVQFDRVSADAPPGNRPLLAQAFGEFTAARAPHFA